MLGRLGLTTVSEKVVGPLNLHPLCIEIARRDRIAVRSHGERLGAQRFRFPGYADSIEAVTVYKYCSWQPLAL